MTVVFDSWAILAHLEAREPAAELVSNLLEDERPIASWINLGEVYYVLRRLVGEDEAAAAVRQLRTLLTAELPDETLIVDAARIKADQPLSYADAFAAATAASHDAVLWTGEPELLVPGAVWRWRDLR